MKETSPLFLRPVWLIAQNSYREFMRDKILYGILLIGALITASSFFLATVSLDQDTRIIQNIGLAAIHLCATVIAIFITTTSVAREIEGRALYILFPKPISRSQYVLGKYLGVLLLVLTTLALLGGFFTLALVFRDRSLLLNTLLSLIASFFEISLLVALAELFACFTAPLNATLYTAALFIIGHSLTLMRQYAARVSGPLVQHLLGLAYYLLPNLDKFAVRQPLLYGLAIPPAAIAFSLLYWLIYTGLVLYLAIQVMQRREV